MGHVSEAMKKSKHEYFPPSQQDETGKVTSVVKAVPPKRKPLPVMKTQTARYSPALVVWHDQSGNITEQYRSLRTHLLAHYKDKPFALVVTSAQSGEGKTITCLNLAFSLGAIRECRTVVVDCDFRKSGVAKALRDKGPRGVADVLRGKATTPQVIRPTTYPNVSVILSGRPSREDAGLTSRPELDEMLRYLRRHYDYVLFDTPPVNALSDAGVVGRVAGDALLVVRMNQTRRESVRTAIRHLKSLDVRITGVVLAQQKYYIPGYLYRYS
jgi:capsular exopolysaccharide synthesis family protein